MPRKGTRRQRSRTRTLIRTCRSFAEQAQPLLDEFCKEHRICVGSNIPTEDDEHARGPLHSDIDENDSDEPDDSCVQRLCLSPMHALAQNPRRTQHTFCRMVQTRVAERLWCTKEWIQAEGERSDDILLQRKRARFKSISSKGASAFLLAVPEKDTKLNKLTWSTMLKRHLGLQVYDDANYPLWCARCGNTMDAEGTHATEQCRSGWNQLHRHGAVQRAWAYKILRAAGVGYTFEEQLLIPGTATRPADVYVPIPPRHNSEAPTSVEPIAYDITVRSTLSTEPAKILKAALKAGDRTGQPRMGNRPSNVDREARIYNYAANSKHHHAL